MRLKKFLRPTILKITTFFLIFSVWLLMMTSGIIKALNIIPCRKAVENRLIWGLCPVNPTMVNNTLYLGFQFTNLLYVLFYFVFIFLFIPYVTACWAIYSYDRWMSPKR